MFRSLTFLGALAALVCLSISAGLLAQESERVGPQVVLDCAIVEHEESGRVVVTCLQASPTHACAPDEVRIESTHATGGVRTTTTLRCRPRYSTGRLETDLVDLEGAPRTMALRRNPLGVNPLAAEACRWTTPVQGLERIALACVDRPGSRARKLGWFAAPGL